MKLLWALVLTAAPVVALAEVEAVLLGEYEWEGDVVGGVSGIEVDEWGRRFVAVSDRGLIYLGQFFRNEEGVITSMEGGATILLDAREEQTPQAEAITTVPNGLVIGFEGRPPQLWFYSKIDAPPDGLITPPREMNAYPPNQALEALASAPDGTLYAILEKPNNRGMHPVFRYSNDSWDVAFEIEGQDPFRPTGADIGPDGKLYVLERSLTARAFASQVRRFDLETGEGETLLRHRPGTRDNLEGISVWRDGEGRIHLVLISDDNLNPIQRTEILDYRLVE